MRYKIIPDEKVPEEENALDVRVVYNDTDIGLQVRKGYSMWYTVFRLREDGTGQLAHSLPTSLGLQLVYNGEILLCSKLGEKP